MGSFPSLPLEPDRARARQSRRAGAAEAPSPPSRIAAAVDDTASGRDAAALGSLLARSTGAELMLVAVREEPLFAVALPDEVNWATLEKQARATLARTRDALAPEARIVVGSDVLIWRGLRDVVRREHRDLLVVGSAHNAVAGRTRMGRSARDLFSYLACPLGVAPSGMRNQTRPRLRRIGVGFDGTAESRAALELAGSTAAAAGAQLEVRRVVDGPVQGEVTAEQAYGADARVEVCVGVSTDVLLELGDYVDLLVVGSARRGRAGQVEAGATGRALLTGAPCPVLLAPRPVS